MSKKKLVVLTGAGISAESGIKTFRYNNGLWENHDVTEVASPEGWARNPHLVLDFNLGSYPVIKSSFPDISPSEVHGVLFSCRSWLCACDSHKLVLIAFWKEVKYGI